MAFVMITSEGHRAVQPPRLGNTARGHTGEALGSAARRNPVLASQETMVALSNSC